MKRICVITTTRAEYGLLYPLLKEIDKDDMLELQLVVGGTHLIQEFGYTKNEIIQDGFKISKEIELTLASDNACSISKSMGLTLMTFSDYVKDNRPDMGIILGDRYEMLAFAAVFVNERIPIAHINGGEITEGALDEFYRHAITKLSILHFTNCNEHRNRVIQMGENPEYVYNVGDTCVDNICRTNFWSVDKLENNLNIPLRNKKIILITYHPVTTVNKDDEQIQELLNALDEFGMEFIFIFTKANADEGGKEINFIIDQYTQTHKNWFLVDSLGRERYLSLLKICSLVIGNSSSGIYEVPFFHIPTINLGNRQKGRLKGKTVFDCKMRKESILKAIRYVLSSDFATVLEEDTGFWGKGNASSQMIQIIKRFLKKDRLIQNKRFYDIKI